MTLMYLNPFGYVGSWWEGGSPKLICLDLGILNACYPHGYVYFVTYP